MMLTTRYRALAGVGAVFVLGVAPDGSRRAYHVVGMGGFLWPLIMWLAKNDN
jgi:hypothetical protein